MITIENNKLFWNKNKTQVKRNKACRISQEFMQLKRFKLLIQNKLILILSKSLKIEKDQFSQNKVQNRKNQLKTIL